MVSMLVEAGHPDSAFWPLWAIWTEAEIVVRRRNGELIAQATLAHAAMIGSQSKKGLKAFTQVIADLRKK